MLEMAIDPRTGSPRPVPPCPPANHILRTDKDLRTHTRREKQRFNGDTWRWESVPGEYE